MAELFVFYHPVKKMALADNVLGIVLFGKRFVHCLSAPTETTKETSIEMIPKKFMAPLLIQFYLRSKYYTICQNDN